MGRAVRRVLVATAVAAVLVACQPVVPVVTRTSRISVDPAARDANGESASPSISADGRYVAFESVATDLTPEGEPGVFVRDRVAGATLWVDHGNSPSISADGRKVAYSAATPSGRIDVFVRDLLGGRSVLASVGLGGGTALGSSHRPSISADGRHVAFISDAPDLVAGDGNGQPDVFVRNLGTGVTVRANVSLSGGDSGQAGYGASRYSETSSVLSADGRFVVFESYADGLVFEQVPGGGGGNIFVRDLEAGVTSLASDVPHQVVFAPAISPDGSKVGYIEAPFGGITGGDLLVRDLETGITTRASVGTGQSASFTFFAPSFSADGRLVAFESSTRNELPDNTPVDGDAFVRDLETGATTRVSVDRAGGDPDGASFLPELSGDGRSVAYVSEASDLVATDTNQLRDVFVAEVGGRDARDRLVDLGDLIAGFDLPKGLATSLTAKVRGALAALDRDNEAAACGKLTALSNDAGAQSGKRLTPSQAATIRAEAAATRELLGCD